MKAVLLLLLFFVVSPVYGQTVLEEINGDIYKSGGVYYHYVYDAPEQTPAPQGYEPFYISHYGRHGSRWLSRETDYSKVMDMFDSAAEAGILTPFGEDVYLRVKAIYEDAAGRAGALTPLGTRQHKEIAGRSPHSLRCLKIMPESTLRPLRIRAVSSVWPLSVKV